MATVVPAGTRAADDHDTPRPRALAAGTGETIHHFGQEDELWSVRDGWDLDQYTFRSGSPIDFQIAISGSFIGVGPDGHLTGASPLFGESARLTLKVWDVDEESGERDTVVVNGTQLPGFLSGANDAWSVNTFEVPVSLLTFPEEAGQASANVFQVLVDTTNTTDIWAVEVDWVDLGIETDPADTRPVVAVHGLEGAADALPVLRDYYVDNRPALEGRIAAPTLVNYAGTSVNEPLLATAVDDLLAQTNAGRVNLVAHSMGGLVAREYAFKNPDKVASVVMLSAPNGGLKAIDSACNDLHSPGIWGIANIVVEADCDGPDDALFQLQTSQMQDIFNRVIDDPDTSSFLAISSDCDDCEPALWFAADKFTERPYDGLVDVASAEWLSRHDPVHPDVHETLLFPLFDTHDELVNDAAGEGLLNSMCALYFELPGCPVLVAGGEAAASRASLSSPSGDLVLIQVASANAPVGGSVNIPLQFEGADEAIAYVLIPQAASVSGSIGATSLTLANELGFKGAYASLTSPADANLVVQNTGAVAAPVTVFVHATSERRITVAPSAKYFAAGQAVNFTVTIDGTAPGDSPVAKLVAADGTSTNVPLTASGGGVWNGSIVPTSSGIYRIDVGVPGSRPRHAEALVSVGGTSLSMAPGFSERVVGDEDGLADALILSPTVSSTLPGTFWVTGEVVDQSGSFVARAGGTVSFDAPGSVPVDLPFTGKTIFGSGLSGPYRLTDVVISNPTTGAIEFRLADAGATGTYDYRSFEHFPVEFALNGFSERGIDADEDGVLEAIEVSGALRLDLAGNYSLHARLLAPDGTEVAQAQSTVTYTAGQNELTLQFDAGDIIAAGKDGPYTVVDLSAYLISQGEPFGYIKSALTTASYTICQFDPCEAAWSASMRVNDDVGTTDQIQPAMAIGTDGTAHAVWRDSRNGNSDIYYASRNPTTGAWSANLRVNDVTTGEQFEPSVAVDASGNVYVVWTDQRVADDRNIYFSKRSAASGTWSASVRVNDDPTNKKPEQRMPAIAVSGSGAAVAVWRDLRANKEHVYGARLAAGASSWSANVQVTSVSSGKRVPDITIGPDGTAHAVWYQPATGDADIWYASLASGSSSWSANTKISDDPGSAFQGEPEIGIDGSGNLIAAWQDWRANPFQLRARHKPAGGAWAPSVVVAADGANAPSLSVRSDGDGFLTWYDGTNALFPNIVSSAFDAATGAWSVGEQLNEEPGVEPGSSPAVVLDATRVIIIWQNGTNVSGDYDYNIFERSKGL